MCRANRSSSGANPGITIASPTTRLHTPGAAEISQPNSSNNNEATGTRLRRRLSRIRHRFTSVSGLRSVRPPCAGTRGKIHGAICQSPRIQRCWRWQ